MSRPALLLTLLLLSACGQSGDLYLPQAESAPPEAAAPTAPAAPAAETAPPAAEPTDEKKD